MVANHRLDPGVGQGPGFWGSRSDCKRKPMKGNQWTWSPSGLGTEKEERCVCYCLFRQPDLVSPSFLPQRMGINIFLTLVGPHVVLGPKWGSPSSPRKLQVSGPHSPSGTLGAKRAGVVEAKRLVRRAGACRPGAPTSGPAVREASILQACQAKFSSEAHEPASWCGSSADKFAGRRRSLGTGTETLG